MYLTRRSRTGLYKRDDDDDDNKVEKSVNTVLATSYFENRFRVDLTDFLLGRCSFVFSNDFKLTLVRTNLTIQKCVSDLFIMGEEM